MGEIWNELRAHNQAKSGRSILALFGNPDRTQRFSAKADGLYFDFFSALSVE